MRRSVVDPEAHTVGSHHTAGGVSSRPAAASAGSSTARSRLALVGFLLVCLWALVSTLGGGGGGDGAAAPVYLRGHVSTSGGAAGGEGVDGGAAVAVGGETAEAGVDGDGDGDSASRQPPPRIEVQSPPRILTVLTTYEKRSGFVKPYREVTSSRDDGYKPTVFVTSNEEDQDPEGVVDFKTGSSRQHRLLAALAEACARYEGTFEWIAIGDDDTAFMYNRATAFLGRIDHTQPVAIGVVDGLNGNAAACYRRECFSPEQKRNTSNPVAANGCCDDFTRPCEVPVFPKSGPDLDERRNYTYSDYGGGGLFWPFGGSGSFVSAGMVKVVGGAEGFRRCARMFSNFNTDVQLAACFKLHGYSMGKYKEGFVSMETADPDAIRGTLAAECSILGVHLGIRHLSDGSTYTPEAFGAAVAAVQGEDAAAALEGGGGGGGAAVVPEASCPESLASLSKYLGARGA